MFCGATRSVAVLSDVFADVKKKQKGKNKKKKKGEGEEEERTAEEEEELQKQKVSLPAAHSLASCFSLMIKTRVNMAGNLWLSYPHHQILVFIYFFSLSRRR